MYENSANGGIRYSKKFYQMLQTGNGIQLLILPCEKRIHSMKALASLSQFLCCYDDVWLQLKQCYNLKWTVEADTLWSNTLHVISTFSTLPLVLTIQSNFVIIFFLASSSKIPAAIPRVTTPTTVSDAISFNSVPISNPLLLAIAALPPSAPLPPDSHTSCSVPPLTSTASIGS